MAPFLLLAAFLSGTAALVAETLWFRALGRGVGTSAEALAVVSAAFLGGLGIGAAVASRRAPRSANPVRAAAVCEAVAGLLVMLSPFALAHVADAHLAVLSALGLEPGPSAWPAALVALPILMLPTSFLGATLPFLVRGRVGRLEVAGRWTGRIYAVNTIGAALGVVTAVGLLLPEYGESLSLRLAGAGNLAAALLLLLAERPLASNPSRAEASDAPAAPLAAPSRPPRAPGLALLASGTLALGAEVAWFRLLEPLTGVHVVGFAVLLCAVLVGTAAGGWVGGLLADRVRRPDLALAAALGVGGVLTVLSVAVAGAVPWLALKTATDAAASATAAAKADGATAAAVSSAASAAGASAVFRARIAGAFLAIVPSLVAFAAAYPLAVRARARSVAGAAEAAGSVYAWNTVGNVLGSLFAGFWLLPRIGGPLTLAALGGAGLAVAAFLWLGAARPRPTWATLLFLLPLGLLGAPGAAAKVGSLGPALPEVVAVGKWWDTFHVASREDLRVLSEILGGTYPRPPGNPTAAPILPREGVVSSVGLLWERGSVRLRQGGLSESKITPSDPDAGSETEVALGLVPYLVHRAPKTALVIGHGAGWTVETLLATPLERVDVAELEPAVLAEVEAYRGPLAVRRARNARLLATDGRLLLRRSAKEGGVYDLVVSQPSHPWVPGAGHLFTRDAYALARSALAKGGVFSQWINVFNTTEPLFRTAIASFREVFPASWALVFHDEVVLVGFTEPPTVDVGRWERAFEGEPVGARARAAGILGPEDVLRRIAADGAGLLRVVGSRTTPSTDDDPRLELGLAWALFGGIPGASKERAAIYQDLRQGFPPDYAAFLPDPVARDRWLARAAMRTVDQASVEEAHAWLAAAPFEGGALGRRARARARLAEAKASGVSADERARLQADAVEFLRSALELAPDDGTIAKELVEALATSGQGAQAAREGEALAGRFPDHGPLLAEWARALVGVGQEAKAADAWRKALAAKSPAAPAGTGMRLARLLTASGSGRAAEARAALRADPSTFTDRAALVELLRLEIDLAPAKAAGDTPETREVEGRLKDAERAAGLERLEAARRLMDGDREAGLEAATTATTLLPDDATAWRLKGWYELRAKEADAAVASLRKAIEVSRDRGAERALARAYLRLFAQDPARLAASAP